jgi:hypothetical protein
MRKVILDTNFIITCFSQKIDFFHEISLLGLSIIIPRQVIREIERVVNSKKKLHSKENAALSLKLLEKYNFQKLNLEGRNVDNAIARYCRENPDVILATLDKELKKKVKNNKLVIRGKKSLEII